MSLPNSNKEISFIFPKSGNLFYEKKKEEFHFCKPHLMPIRSYTLEKLEKMQLEAQKQLKAKTAEQKDS
jgi:BBSome-interacting protein 1